jgi:hypothetical protein
MRLNKLLSNETITNDFSARRYVYLLEPEPMREYFSSRRDAGGEFFPTSLFPPSTDVLVVSWRVRFVSFYSLFMILFHLKHEMSEKKNLAPVRLRCKAEFYFSFSRSQLVYTQQDNIIFFLPDTTQFRFGEVHIKGAFRKLCVITLEHICIGCSAPRLIGHNLSSLIIRKKLYIIHKCKLFKFAPWRWSLKAEIKQNCKFA